MGNPKRTVETGIRQLARGVYEVRVGYGRDGMGRPVQHSRTVRGSLEDARRVRGQMQGNASSGPEDPRCEALAGHLRCAGYRGHDGPHFATWGVILDPQGG